MTQKAKAVLNRFFKAFIFGAISSTTVIGAFVGTSLRDWQAWLGLLGFTMLIGGVNGILMAMQKASSWIEAESIK